MNRFYIIRCMKHCAEFLGSTEKFRLTNELFLVHSRGVSFDQIVKTPLPVFVKTGLLPFKDRIVFDGVMEFIGKDLGDEVGQMMYGCYLNLIEDVGVISSLPDEREVPAAKAKTAQRKKPARRAAKGQ